MHSTGVSRLEFLFRNQHFGEERTGKHFAWGTGTIHTPSLSTSRTQSSVGEGAAASLCIISIPSALTATWRMLQGGQEQAVCPLPCQQGSILYIPDTLDAEFIT